MCRGAPLALPRSQPDGPSRERPVVSRRVRRPRPPGGRRARAPRADRPRGRGRPRRPDPRQAGGSGAGRREALVEEPEREVDLLRRGDERRDDPDHVHVRAGRQDDQFPKQRLGLDPLRQVGVGYAAVADTRLDELDRDHETETPDVADGGVTRGKRLQPSQELVTALAGIRDEPLVLDHVERGVRRRARDDVAAICPAMRAGLPGGHHLGACEDPGEWHPRSDALGDDEDVGLHVPMLDREHLARAAESRLDLVRDEHDAVLPGDLPEPWQEAGRGHDVAALTEHGLDDDPRDAVGVDDLPEGQVELLLPVARARVGTMPAAGRSIAVRVGRVVDGARQGLERAAVDVLGGRQGHRLRGPAVVAVAERHHGGTPGRDPRELDRGLDRFGSRVRQERLPRTARQHGAQAVVQPETRLVVGDVLLRVDDLRCLCGDRGGDAWMRVARVRDADAGRVVEVTGPIAGDQPRALAAVDVEVGDPAPDGGHDGVVRQRDASDLIAHYRHGSSRLFRHSVATASFTSRAASSSAMRRSRRSPRRSHSVFRRTSPTAPTKTIVPMTWTWGGRLLRMLAQTQSGNVVAVPAVKLVMMKSSIDSENASSAPARMPGRMSGNVTFQKVAHGEAPRSMAASSRCRGNPCIRARTVTTTKLMLNMTWAIRIVWSPRGKKNPPVRLRNGSWDVPTNNVSRLAPRTISGVAIGMKMNRLVPVLPRKS